MQQESYLKCPCENCGAHIEFPAQAVGESVRCPHCDQNTKLFRLAIPIEPDSTSTSRTKSRRILLVALICAALGTAMAIGILAGKKSGESAKNANVNVHPGAEVKVEIKERAPKNKHRQQAAVKSAKLVSEPTTEWNGFKPSGISLEKTDKSRLIYAVGTVRNNTDRQRFGVKVELDLFDEQNTKLGSATDYVQVIEPGKDWNFKALVTDSKAVRVELAAIKEN